MVAETYAIDIPVSITRYGYFLYVWKATAAQGDLFLYVGRTGCPMPRPIRSSFASASTLAKVAPQPSRTICAEGASTPASTPNYA